VKIPHLNDYDLARVTVLPFELQWYELERMKSTWAPYSYSYVKNQVLDILNIIPGPFGEGPRTPWHVIEQGIRRAAKSPEAIAANLGVAKALYEYADEHKIIGRKQEFAPWTVTYWYPAAIAIDGRPTVPFIDPRRSKNLSTASRRFIFSIMHERIRAAYPDFSEISLGIVRFGTLADGARKARLITDDRFDLIDIDTLNRMIERTYSIWREIHEKRAATRWRQEARG
jgi:hypothetical protein